MLQRKMFHATIRMSTLAVDLERLPPILTAADLAEIYRCSPETVRRKTEKGVFQRIPGFHALLYRRVDILALLLGPTKPEDDDAPPPSGP
jgi:hypothetical protein